MTADRHTGGNRGRIVMGLIRKSLAVGTVGLVNPSSKKQRVAKATMRNTAATATAVQQQLEFQRQQAAEQHAYRYQTDATYRAWVDQKAAAQAEAERQRRERLAAQRRMRTVRATQAVAIPALVLVVALLAVAVWTPQMAVAKARRQPFTPWRRSNLTGRFHALRDMR